MASRHPDKRLDPDFDRNADECRFDRASIAARLKAEFAGILTEPLPANVKDLLAQLSHAPERERRTG